MAAAGIASHNQSAANATSSANNWNTIGSVAGGISSVAGSLGGYQQAANLFNSSGTSVGSQVDTAMKTNPDLF